MKIVSLCPSVTDTVFALGAGAELVGRTKFCVLPAGAVDAVARVGGTKNPDVARIVALGPDVVLMNDEENRREDAEAFAAAGLRVWSSMPRTVAESARAVRGLGAAIGRVAQAAALADAIDARAARTRAAAAGAPRVSFAYLVWRRPWMAVNGDTYIASLLGVAGGDNVFAGRPTRYPEVGAHELTAAAPVRVLLSSEPFPFAEAHADELAAATGLGRQGFVLVDGERLSWHGARTLAGLAYAREVMAAAAP